MADSGNLYPESGPFGTDVHWIVLNTNFIAACAVFQGASGERDFFHRLQQLPGFDNDAVISAMGSVENAHFLCWKSPDLSAGQQIFDRLL